MPSLRVLRKSRFVCFPCFLVNRITNNYLISPLVRILYLLYAKEIETDLRKDGAVTLFSFQFF